MGDYETVMAIAGFLVISHLVLVNGGAGEVFFDIPQGEKPPRLFPEPREGQIKSVDIGDPFYSNNIEFVDSGSLSNPSPAFQSGTVAVLVNESEDGELQYNIPGVQYVEAFSTKNCGGFFGDSGLQVGSGQNTTGFDYVCGVTKANVEESNVNYVNFKFEGDGGGGKTPRLFGFNYSESGQSVSSEDSIGGAFGVIAGFLGAIGEAVTFPLRLWDYFEHFPIYVQLFYGTILAWMVVDIVQIG